MKDQAPVGPEPFDCVELRDFVRLFENGEFFASHEALEARWLVTRDPFERGLIIYAAAFVKRDRGNARGTRRHLEKALHYLAAHPDTHRGIDVAGLRAHAESGIEHLLAQPDAASLPGLKPPRLRAGPETA